MKIGTMIGGTSQGLIRSLRPICRSFQKKSLASARPSSSSQNGELLLLSGLVGGRLAIALVLLGGGLGLIRRDGLRGFIGTLLLIGHSISFENNLKTIFQVLLQDRPIPVKYNDYFGNIQMCQIIVVFNTSAARAPPDWHVDMRMPSPPRRADHSMGREQRPAA